MKNFKTILVASLITLSSGSVFAEGELFCQEGLTVMSLTKISCKVTDDAICNTVMATDTISKSEVTLAVLDADLQEFMNMKSEGAVDQDVCVESGSNDVGSLSTASKIVGVPMISRSN